MLHELLWCGFSALSFMTIVFLIADRLKRYDLVDSAWGLVFIVIALTSYLRQTYEIVLYDLKLLVLLLVSLWGVRLSWHIFTRFMRSREEDPRYTEIRRSWKGNEKLNAYTRIYVVQAILATFISLPILFIGVSSGSQLPYIVALGFIIWLLGFMIEIISDKQLKQFTQDSKNGNKIMQSGTWKYSRHPNYFGEITLWFGVYTIAAATPYGWASAFGWLVISYLILHISGLPPSEKRLSRRDGWAGYKKRTSIIIPLPPRSAVH